MSDVLVIMCTCPDEATAARLANGLVDARLAACVNVVPGLRSIYRWQDDTCDEAEVLLVIKSLAPHYGAVEAWLLQHHPYDVPEVVAIEAGRVAGAYRAWLGSTLQQP